MLTKAPPWVELYVKAISALGPADRIAKKGSCQKVGNFAIAHVSTVWLVWVYAIFVDSYFSSNELVAISYMVAVIHTLSPLLLIPFTNTAPASFVLLFACYIQQFILNYGMNGLTEGAILIWYGVLPLMGGVLLGRAGLFIWSILVTVEAGFFIYASYSKLVLANPIDHSAIWIGHGIAIPSWGILVSVIVSIFLKQFRNQQKLLEARSEKIDNLLRILTHDVSNSLNVINTASTLFKHYDSDKKRVQYYFNKMDLASANITEVIQSVRMLHSAENGWETIENKPISILDSIEHCHQLLEDRLRSKNIKLDINSESLDGQKVLADPSFLNNHVLMNVLSNAIKFSYSDTKIKIGGKKENGRLRVYISDRGVGMSPEEARVIFKEKWNKSKIGTRGESGSGFGMVIMKSFMDRFGADVEVCSIPDKGTIVWLDFLTPDKKSLKVQRYYPRAGNFVVKSVNPEESHYVASTKEKGRYKLSNYFS